MIEPNPRDLIRNEFMARKSRNARYSLRAYAQYLDVPVATLCRYLNARGDIKASECFRILRKLNFIVVREVGALPVLQEARYNFNPHELVQNPEDLRSAE